MASSNQCTINGLKGYNADNSSSYNESGWDKDYSFKTTYAGANSREYFISIIKFTTPSFTGVSDSISIKLNIVDGPVSTSDKTVTLNYAILKSDSNKSSYWGVTGSVSDSNQMVSGSFTFDGITEQQQFFNLSKLSTRDLSPNTSYYLILWTADKTGFLQVWNDSSNKHTITLNSKETYTITFNSNGGKISTEALTKIEGESLSLSSISASKATRSTTFTINGNTQCEQNNISQSARKHEKFTHSSWNTKSDGSGTSYSKNGYYTLNSSATLYAIFDSSYTYENNTLTNYPWNLSRSDTIDDTYRVNLDANKGTISAETSIDCDKITSYTFGGWYSGLNGTGTKYDIGTSFTSQIQLYAYWISNTRTEFLTLPDHSKVQRKGYDFLDWCSSPSGNGSHYTGGSKYTPSSDVTLYAIYEPKGLIRVKTPSNWREALVWVFNGTKWVQAIPYIYDGSQWKIGG